MMLEEKNNSRLSHFNRIISSPLAYMYRLVNGLDGFLHICV